MMSDVLLCDSVHIEEDVFFHYVENFSKVTRCYDFRARSSAAPVINCKPNPSGYDRWSGTQIERPSSGSVAFSINVRPISP